MARIRTIKPSFFTSLTIADLTPEQRLTFIGLWTEADDEGRYEYDRRLVKAALWPLDERSLDDVEGDVRALTECSLITHYVVNQRQYLAVNGWSEHQHINRKTKSKLPAPSEGEITPLASKNEDSVQTHAQLTEDSRQEGKGKEGKGITTSPPPAPRAGGYPDDFEAFWKHYPKKVEKPDALKAWKATLKRTDAQTLIDAVRAYRFPTDPQYVKYPAVWLRKGAWEDTAETAPGSAGHMTDEDRDAQDRMALRGKYKPWAPPAGAVWSDDVDGWVLDGERVTQ